MSTFRIPRYHLRMPVRLSAHPAHTPTWPGAASMNTQDSAATSAAPRDLRPSARVCTSASSPSPSKSVENPIRQRPSPALSAKIQPATSPSTSLTSATVVWQDTSESTRYHLDIFIAPLLSWWTSTTELPPFTSSRSCRSAPSVADLVGPPVRLKLLDSLGLPVEVPYRTRGATAKPPGVVTALVASPVCPR